MARSPSIAFAHAPRGGGGVFATPLTFSRGGKPGSAGGGGSGGGVLVYFLWFVQMLAFAFLAAAMLSFSPADWPSHAVFPHNQPTHNWCGPVGAWPAYQLFSLLGFGAWVLLGLWGLFLFVSAFVTRVTHPPVRFLGAVVMAAAVSGLHALLFPSLGSLAPNVGGGLIGNWAAGPGGELAVRFGGVGSALWLLLIFLVGAVVAVDVWVVIVPVWAFKQVQAATPPVVDATSTVAGHTATAGKSLFGWVWQRIGRPEVEPLKAGTSRGRKKGEAVLLDTPGGGGKKDGKKGDKTENKDIIDERAGGIGGTEAFVPEEHVVAPESAEAADAASGEAVGAGAELFMAAGSGGVAGGAAGAAEAPKPRSMSAEELRAKIAALPVVFASKNKKSATDADLRDIQNTQDLAGYKFPGLDLLEEPDLSYPEKMEAYVRDQAAALERALKEYRIDGEVVGIESGPVVTLFEVKLAAGTKVAVLSAIASDLARSLKAINIRIVPNTVGRDTVGVEVPNTHKEKVRLKELMTRADAYKGMALPMFLGKDGAGAPLIVDLASQPHMLIAGTTGSGKSVCMSSILMSFLYTRMPNELKLVLVDPKMVELSQFKDIPHLMCPVVTEMSKAAAILEWAVRKMDERYELLVEAGCRDISGYNALTPEDLKERFNPKDEVEEARIPKKLPYMVFVIDELADLMMTNKEVEHAIVRLAQKARAVGMHLIVATQRPQANVVTGLIKANMPGRISFKVASGMDSRIVLDQKGGELLLGMGDMLYLSPKSSKLTRAQGTLVDDKEIRKVARFLKEIAAPSFETSLMQLRTGAAAASGLGGDDEHEGEPGTFGHDGISKGQADPLFAKAVEVVLETKKGSVSLLQRRLAIGYTRSSRLVDAMWKAGIVGDHKGTVDRDVLITTEEWEAMKAMAAADAQAAEEPAAGTGGAGGKKQDATGNLFAQVAAPRARVPQTAGPVPGSAAAEDGLADEHDVPRPGDEEV